jgi:hypothetical protein
LLLDIATGVPPGGATLVRYTVQDVLVPPLNVLGPQTTEETLGCAPAAGVKPSEKFRELPFRVAVNSTGVLVLTVDGAVAVKVLEFAPVVSVTEGGTEIRSWLPLASVTTVALAAGPVRLIVHVAVPGGEKLPGTQVRLDRVIVGVSVSEKVFDTPLRVAVITAVVLLLTVEVVTVKLALEEPALTVTEAGTLAEALPLESDTLVLLETLPLMLTVQVELVGGVTLAGAQVRLESTGPDAWLIVIVPGPALVIGTDFGVVLPSEAARFENVTVVDVFVVVDAIWNVTVASTPLAIAVLLSPATMHRMSPDAGVLQVTSLPATVAAAPAA